MKDDFEELSVPSVITRNLQMMGFLGSVDHVMRTKPKSSIEAIVHDWEKQWKDRYMAFHNQWVMISVLHTYIVLPQQRYFDKLPATSLSELDPRWGLQGLACNLTLAQFVRRLRNAVSHGHVAVNSDLQFRFRDRKGVGAPFDFEVIVEEAALRKFCQALAYFVLEQEGIADTDDGESE